MKKVLVFALALAALPMFSYAATYQYVDTAGEVEVVTANTADEAIAVAPNRMATSGVMVVSSISFGIGGIGGNGSLDVDGDGTIAFQYVDVTGDVDMIEAVNAEQALVISPNRAEHNGVIMAEINPIPESVEVNL